MTSKHIITICTLLIVTTTNMYAQRKINLKEISKNYDVQIQVENCNLDKQDCNGKAAITILNKAGKVFQKLTSEDLYLTFNEDKSVNNTMEMYNENSPVIIADFNFDGTEDLSIRNGNNSGYGGPSYDVYVYNITKKQFVLSKELTELASTNLGMFEVDKKRKRLITHQKSGAALHYTNEYAVLFKKGLQLVKELEEDATADENYVVVTEKNLVNGKWQVKKKKFKTKEYYK